MNGSVFPTATGSELTANYVTTETCVKNMVDFCLSCMSVSVLV